MSAWSEIVSHDDSAEWLALCSRAREEVQRETSRKNAAVQRNRNASFRSRFGRDISAPLVIALIDPEVTT
ncbi:hypothetical protein AT728_07395 [Streptomyces silvensis]|uniref:Uncharacterized protein n=1 Tax=Streptomyces silvensis TaxID=1765722 RepID=A0A0W7X8A2_9ACTN|nr:hypothetical protein AT728_07395 [Streptomyces silvensis]